MIFVAYPSTMSKLRHSKVRLDRLLVERGLAGSREKAQALILAGQVLVENQKVEKAGAQVNSAARIQLLGEPMRFVSRGGIKLDGALDFFHVEAAGKVCLDIGASTGGFTDCLLQRGARKVYALDVGQNQLAWKLRCDPQVVSLEGVNARYLGPNAIGEKIDLVTMDVSFISATLILPVVPPLLASEAEVMILVKPQFEVGREQVGRGGIVRDSRLHAQAIRKVAAKLEELGFTGLATSESVLPGATGNREFFLLAHWRQRIETQD